MCETRRSIRSLRLVSGTLLTLLAWACSSPSPDQRITEPTDPSSAKVSGVAVSSTKPAYGDRGTTIDVRVFGSGFATDAQATWLLHGVADPARVRTNRTMYLSSTELIANITISSDADLTFWDVAVRSGGKNGVGTEIFEVSTAEFLGTAGNVVTMNEAGQFLTYGTEGIYLFDPSGDTTRAGDGQAWGLDPLGNAVAGTSYGLAIAWMRQGTTTTFVSETLPRSSGSAGGRAAAAVRDGTGTLILGGWEIFPAPSKGAPGLNRPAVWRYDGGWSAPTFYVTPSGTTLATIRAMNARLQAVGHIAGETTGAVWDDANTVTVLDGLADGINASGTLAVGKSASSGSPLFWYRTASGSWNPTGIPLPSLGTIKGTCQAEAKSVNDAGYIVGRSCDATGKAQATVWRLDLSGPTPVLVSGPQRLPGLGVKTTSSTNDPSGAVAISNTAPYVIGGFATNPGSAGGYAIVRWLMW
jgi:hypothetical protein